MIFRLNESLPDLSWSKGDIITLATLQQIMSVYAEVNVTVIMPQ